MDLDENWTFDDHEASNDKIHVIWTLVHELGHTLGLDHSGFRNSVMYGIMLDKDFSKRMNVTHPTLNKYDRNMIRRLYGKRRADDPPRAEVYRIIKNQIKPEQTLVDPYSALENSRMS